MAGLVSKQGGKKVAGKNMNVFPPAKGGKVKVQANAPGKSKGLSKGK